MRDPNGQTISTWTAKYPPFHGDRLEGNRNCDVCVIGGGIAGLTVAYLLAKEGRSVILLEKDGIGSGESGRTTAHFTSAIDDRYFEIERLHGEENSRLSAHSQADAILLAEKIVADERIDCDLRQVPGYLFLGPEHDTTYLQREYFAAKKAGLEVDWIPSFFPALSSAEWIVFKNQMQLHPMKYLLGLKKAFQKKGGKVFTDSCVTRVERKTPSKVHLENGSTVGAKTVVVATNTPFIDKLKMHTKQAAYRTYVIAARIPHHTFPEGLFWDTSDPYHYLRMERDENDGSDRIIIGGEDHKTGQVEHPETGWRRLESWARARFPTLGRIEYRWSGQVMEPLDFLGYAGLNPGSENIYIVTGDSGNGMTNGTIGAKIIADAVLGRENFYAGLYDPSRKSVRAAPEFLKENSNTAAQFADWFKPSEVDSIAQLARGEGAVFRRHGKPVAVSRDADGNLHSCTAICPHLKAVLRWNSAERSWDCPAHGSRFSGAGKRLNGPADRGLVREEVPGVHDLPRRESPEKTIRPIVVDPI